MNASQRQEYLSALGLSTWVLRSSTVAQVSDVRRLEADLPEAKANSEIAREAGFDWPELRARVAACTRCSLSATRTQTVFGVGNPQAEWLIVGEAPGAEEDRQGEPFVGRAGQLLNAMLRAVGLAREQVYIANVLKCRPPGNRDPAPAEATQCLPYLEQQIALLKPKVMLAVGRIAAQNLLRTDKTLGSLRQQVHRFGVAQLPLIVTYHPHTSCALPLISARVGKILSSRARWLCVSSVKLDLQYPKVDVRPMHELDIPVVGAIEKAAYQFPWSEGIFRDCLRVGYVCRIIDVAGDIAGYGIMSVGAGEAHILNVCIREEYRSRGFARKVLLYLLERARAAGMYEAFLEVRPSNVAAARLYHSLGFEQVGIRRGYYQATVGREDAAVLRRVLSADIK